MAWKIELDPLAEKELDKLDPQIARRILSFLHQRLATQENPRMLGEALKGSHLGDCWKYCVGDYRIIAKINDNDIVILVLKLANRKEVYR